MYSCSPAILDKMNTMEEITRLTAIRNHFRLALANLIVAGICVALSGYQFLRGGILAGAIIVAVSLLAVFAANTHERRARQIRSSFIDIE